MAAATSRLGLGATYSTTYADPSSLARAFATLDHLSGGRAAWNVVTSVNNGEAAELRARRATSATTSATTGPTSSWRWRPACGTAGTTTPSCSTASAASSPTRDKVHELDHGAATTRSRGPLTMPRSPQGRPVVIQAGSSGRGQEFAARWAEVVFADPADAERMRRFRVDLRDKAERQGRGDAPPKVLAAVMPFVGRSRAEAEELRRAPQRAGRPDGRPLDASRATPTSTSRPCRPTSRWASSRSAGCRACSRWCAR